MIAYGADPYIKDKQGKCAFDLTNNPKLHEILNGKVNTDIFEENTEEMSSVFLSPNSVFSPNSQGALSPISEVISYDFSDFGHTDKHHPTLVLESPVKEKSHEIKTFSNHDSTIPSSIKSFRNKDYDLKPLFG